MLNLINNNLSLFENNLISYGLLLGSASIIGFSLYYYFNSGNIFKTPTIDNITSSNETTDQTINNVEKHYVDSATQTDDTMLYDYLNARIMENMTQSSSPASHYSPSEFIQEYQTNPYFTSYIDNILKWTEDTADSVGSSIKWFRNGSFPTTSSEHQFVEMLEMIRDIKKSLIDTTSNISPQFNIEYIRETKLNEIIKYVNDQYPTTTSDPLITQWIKSIVDQYDHIQLLSTVCQTEIINKINCNIIIWSCGIF
jgi:hypothetical protein